MNSSETLIIIKSLLIYTNPIKTVKFNHLLSNNNKSFPTFIPLSKNTRVNHEELNVNEWLRK